MEILCEYAPNCHIFYCVLLPCGRLNSFGDVVCVALGYLFLQHVVRTTRHMYQKPRSGVEHTWRSHKWLRICVTSPTFMAFLILATLECLLLFLIRDCLICLTMQFFIAKIGIAKPSVLLFLETQRLPLMLSPHVLTCP